LPRRRRLDRRLHGRAAGARRATRLCGDVGRGQLHPRLRDRPEIVSLEETDIRTATSAQIQEQADIVVIDASFISLKLVLPPAIFFAAPRATLVALVKPQFEAERRAIKKGIVRDAVVHERICGEMTDFVRSLGWRVMGIMPSPISGGDGNQEFLLGAARD